MGTSVVREKYFTFLWVQWNKKINYYFSRLFYHTPSSGKEYGFWGPIDPCSNGGSYTSFKHTTFWAQIFFLSLWTLISTVTKFLKNAVNISNVFCELTENMQLNNWQNYNKWFTVFIYFPLKLRQILGNNILVLKILISGYQSDFV